MDKPTFKVGDVVWVHEEFRNGGYGLNIDEYRERFFDKKVICKVGRAYYYVGNSVDDRYPTKISFEDTFFKIFTEQGREDFLWKKFNARKMQEALNETSIDKLKAIYAILFEGEESTGQ